MAQENAAIPDSTEAWATYWRGAHSGGSFASGGAAHPGFTAFWTDALGEFLAARSNEHAEPSILDIATGSGAVVDVLARTDGVELDKVTCVDFADAAIKGVRERHPGVNGVVADAAAIPLDAGKFDLVTSQFGVEYAGTDGVTEAARLLAPGGHVIFLMHIESGALHQQCLRAIEALDRVAESGFLQLATEFFEAGFAAVGGADRQPYEAAAKKLNPAIAELDAVLTEFGADVADGTLDYLYSTVEKMHGRIQHYDPDESLAWLRSMSEELPAFRARLRDMNDACLDQQGIQAVRANLVAAGCSTAQPEPLLFEGDPLPFAWVMQASKAG